nr:MAG TPA: hypothetical protein [Bacteriophage sp.]
MRLPVRLQQYQHSQFHGQLPSLCHRVSSRNPLLWYTPACQDTAQWCGTLCPASGEG